MILLMGECRLVTLLFFVSDRAGNRNPSGAGIKKESGNTELSF